MKSIMEIALSEAKLALLKDEVPIGAIIINKDGHIISKSRNKNRELNDPTAHAEILAIRMACNKIKSDKLVGYSIYVTLQPCEMCLHAILNARISRLYYGASDLKNINLQKKYDIISEKKNFNIEVYSGINEKKCSDLLINFFKTKRNRR
ncbi:MAG: nucleoside deaminase [Paracoccaceae bacterium]